MTVHLQHHFSSICTHFFIAVRIRPPWKRVVTNWQLVQSWFLFFFPTFFWIGFFLWIFRHRTCAWKWRRRVPIVNRWWRRVSDRELVATAALSWGGLGSLRRGRRNNSLEGRRRVKAQHVMLWSIATLPISIFIGLVLDWFYKLGFFYLFIFLFVKGQNDLFMG